MGRYQRKKHEPPCSSSTVPIPVEVCSWYFSMSMWRLVVKKSSLAMSLWYIETMSFFCLDSEELCLSRLMLKKKKKFISHRWRCRNQDTDMSFVLHGSFLALLQSLPVFFQRTDGVPRLTTSPPQRAVSQYVLRVGFCKSIWENIV